MVGLKLELYYLVGVFYSEGEVEGGMCVDSMAGCSYLDILDAGDVLQWVAVFRVRWTSVSM